MSGKLFYCLRFSEDFFSPKDSAQNSASKYPIDFFSISGVWHLKTGPKSKMGVPKQKNDTKAGITPVWNEVRPKSFHQKLAFVEGFPKMWC